MYIMSAMYREQRANSYTKSWLKLEKRTEISSCPMAGKIVTAESLFGAVDVLFANIW